MPQDPDKRRRGILALDGPRRYAHFIKSVVDREVAWGLRAEGGWALATLENGAEAFPVWPSDEHLLDEDLKM